MAILTVGPTSTFPTIAAAIAATGTGDIISIEAGYGNENATVTVAGLSFDGGPTSININLQLASGISTITLLGTAPINVLDNAADGNGINGNDGDNVITVTGGADAVSGGLGTDRLVVDYHLTSGAVTGNSTTNVADAGGLGIVTINGGFEHFTILTGSGADTITTGAGDDIINTGEGASTVTAGAGANSITGGSGADTVTALDGGNFIDGGGGDNTLTSGGGNDVITGGLGVDIIVAGGGDDVVTVQGGADTSNSGAGNDRLIVDFSSSTTNVNGGVTGGTLAGGYDGAFADVAGTSSVVFQGTENFTITTGSGNDVIATGDGDDVLDGGAGSDQLNGGGGADTLLIGLGSDALDGGAGTDTVIFSAARANYQVSDLGGGVLQTIDLRAGSPDGTDTLVNMEGFAFTDGTFDATTVLNVAPTLGGDLAIAVANGGTVVVTAADLTATDADSTNSELVYTVTGTLHGTVLLAGIAATSFTETDILANAVSFQHDGSASDGSFTVSLTDGTAVPQVTTVTAIAGNAAPSATNDALSAVAEDSGQRTVLGSSLTGNDSAGPSSESGQTLTVTAVSNVIGGSAIVSGGNVLFTPTANFNGAASFDYTVTDNGTTNGTADPLTATATASFTVTEANDAPSATNDALSAVSEDSGQRTILGSSLTGNDSAGPSSESGQTLTVTAVSNVIGGSASVSGGNVLFTPTANFNGAASFDYTVTDDGTTNGAPAPLTTTATTSFSVTEVNDTPSATNDALSAAAEDSSQRTILGSSLTGNDSAGSASESGQTLTVTAVSNVIGGSAIVSGGNVLFTPTANFNGAASFDYTVTDDGTTNGVADPLMATATASFTVTEVNDAPSATNDALSAVSEDSGQRTILGSSLTGNDSAGPSSESGQTLTVTAVSNVIGGSASVSSGNVLFTPTANFNGAASFDYTVTDDGTTNGAPAPLTTTATASFSVNALNDPPTLGGDLGIGVANGGTAIVTATDLTATDADSTNTQLVYTVTGALHGAVLLAGSAATSFTQADVIANAVSFQHDGSGTNGNFTVSLTDGTATPQVATVTAAITIGPQVANDFDGDGHSDILWQNSDGTPAVWLMDGTGVATYGPLLFNSGPSWHEKAAADFNADGKADILWQTDSGAAAVWLMDGTGVATAGPVLSNPGPTWQVKDAADFNADGKADILWQNDDGAAAVWLMDGTGVATAGPVLSNPGPTWHAKAAADFNADGKADILWQNDNGATAVWLMDGTGVAALGPVLSDPDPAWHVKAAADFNADGKADILWQNDNGAAAVWLMDGTGVATVGPVLSNPGSSWHAKDAGDYNGDGKADILWQNDDGTPGVWLMDGVDVMTTGGALSNPGAAWQII